MKFEIVLKQGLAVITPLEKRIDAHGAPAFRAALIEQVELGHYDLLVDLKHVEFIDSSGLGAMVSVLKRIGRQGYLKVASPADGVRSMLELTRLNRVIEITDAVS